MEGLRFLMTCHYFFSNICSNKKQGEGCLGQGKVNCSPKVRVITG